LPETAFPFTVSPPSTVVAPQVRTWHGPPLLGGSSTRPSQERSTVSRLTTILTVTKRFRLPLLVVPLERPQKYMLIAHDFGGFLPLVTCSIFLPRDQKFRKFSDPTALYWNAVCNERLPNLPGDCGLHATR
jgi:hypothetical protein